MNTLLVNTTQLEILVFALKMLAETKLSQGTLEHITDLENKIYNILEGV